MLQVLKASKARINKMKNLKIRINIRLAKISNLVELKS